MSIPINSLCYSCLLTKRVAFAQSLGDEATATAFSKAVMQLFLEAEPDADSSLLGQRINGLLQKFYHLDPDRFQEEKRQSNLFILERMDQIRARIKESSDPIYAALQFAILGNYIDFAALGKSVSLDALDKMLENAHEIPLDQTTYASFSRDLQNAKKLLILCDNAGEIGFDRVLAEQIQKTYPEIAITFCVRGKPVHNDATREDAAMMQIPFPVIDNGCDIGGTVLRYVNQETRDALQNADVILAKGMGNTESMLGCGYNVYYAFLIKCPRFAQFFDKPHMTPMFIREIKA